MNWLWTEYRPKKRIPERKPRADGEKPRVNIIGPHLRHLQQPSDLAEIRRLIEGIGAEVNMVFPLGSHLADVRGLRTRMSTSAFTASSGDCSARRLSGPTCRRRSDCTARQVSAQSR